MFTVQPAIWNAQMHYLGWHLISTKVPHFGKGKNWPVPQNDLDDDFLHSSSPELCLRWVNRQAKSRGPQIQEGAQGIPGEPLCHQSHPRLS